LAVSTASSKGVAFWDADTGRAVPGLDGPQVVVRSVAWSADGKWLATGSEKSVRVWNAESRRVSREYKFEDTVDGPVRWSPGGETLAVARHGQLYRYGEGLGEAGVHDSSRVGSGYLLAIAWSPDGKTVATGTDSGLLQLSPMETGGEQGRVSAGASNWAGESWSRDGTLLALAAVPCGEHPTKALRVIDLRAARQLRGFVSPHPLEAGLSLLPDNQRIGVPPLDGSRIDRVDLRTAKAAEPLSLVAQPSPMTGRGEWSPDGAAVATTHRDEVVRIWVAETGVLRRALAEMPPGPAPQPGAFEWSPDAATLATGCRDGTIRLWSADGRPLRTLTSVGGREVRPVQWAPTGGRLASLVFRIGGNSLDVWDTNAGEQRARSLTPTGGGFECFGWSPDGRAIAGANTRAITVVNAITGKIEGEIPFSRPINDMVAVRWTGPWTVAVLRRDCTLDTWDLRRGRPAGTALAGLHPLATAAVDADGHVALGGEPSELADHFVYVAETAARQETLTPEQFATRFRWKNDASHVQLVSPEDTAPKPGRRGR
jgi:WD40 repeat protein